MRMVTCILLLVSVQSDGAANPSHNRSSGAEQINNQAAALHESGNYAEAESLYLAAIQAWEAEGVRSEKAAITISNLATLYRQRGRHRDAEPLFRRALAILDETAGPASVSKMTTLNNAAEFYRSQGKLDD